MNSLFSPIERAHGHFGRRKERPGTVRVRGLAAYPPLIIEILAGTDVRLSSKIPTKQCH